MSHSKWHKITVIIKNETARNGWKGLTYAKPVFASYVGNGQATRTIQAGTFMKLVFLVKDGQIVGAASKDTPYVNDGTTYLQVYDNHFVLGGGFCNENGITYSYFGL